MVTYSKPWGMVIHCPQLHGKCVHLHTPQSVYMTNNLQCKMTHSLVIKLMNNFDEHVSHQTDYNNSYDCV